MNNFRKFHYFFAIAAICALMLQLIPAETLAFKSGAMFDNVHLQIIKAALTPLGFQPEAIAKIGEGHKSLDEVASYKFWVDKHHCDANQIKEGYSYFLGRMEKAIGIASDAYKNPASVDQARFTIGEGYHTLQDFYSHSNWIELQYFKKDPQDPIIPFPWHQYIPWSWNQTAGQWEHSWLQNLKLPVELKTGYFTSTEFENEGRKWVSEKAGVDTARYDLVRRQRMVDAAMHEYPGRRFASDLEYKKRMENERFFHTAIEFVVKDPGRSHLHAELNKDDENQRESKLITPSGESLFAVAKSLATEDTERMWKVAEKQMWKKYDDRAALIIPALMGREIPELNVDVNLNRSQQARTMPLAGNINVKVRWLPDRMALPLKVKVQAFLKPRNVAESSSDRPIERTLEFKKNKAEKNINLESLNLVIGNQSGEFDLVVKAWFECDPQYKPFYTRIPIGSGGLSLISAKCTPNPAFVNEEVKLDVEYNYQSNAGGLSQGEGSGTIEKADGSYRHNISKTVLSFAQNADNTNQIYSERWTPPSAGKYFWYPKISFNNSAEASSVVEITVGDGGPYKDITGSGVLDKTECSVGDTVTLSVKYKVKGIARDPVTVTETSQIDGPATIRFPDSTPTLSSRAGEAIERTKTYTFKATKSGVYDWRFAIEAPGFTSLQDTLRLIVKAEKRLLVDNATVLPESGGPGEVRLKVDYHLGGMDAGSAQEVRFASNITGPLGQTFPETRQTVNGPNGSGSLILSFNASTPGDYAWAFEIDGAAYGREQRTLSFRIEDKTVRSIDLISAKVTPVKGTVGTTHSLEVWYKVSGLKPNESVEVHENDYVQYAKQETNPTVTKSVTEPNINVRKVAGFVTKQAGKHTWNFIIDAKGFRTLYGAVPFEAYEDEVKPKLQARLQYQQITIAPGDTKNCTIYISGYKGNTQDRVEIVYPDISDNWGSLPGQVQVFPGNTSMDPWSMRGAGDYTKEYAAGQGYRARATAPPGVTPVKIIVRQKDVGQVTLTLFVKIVGKGESTIGTEIDNPRLPGTYIPKIRRSGTGEDIPGSGEVETDQGTVGPGGVTRKPQGNSTDNNNNNNGNPGNGTNNEGENSDPNNGTKRNGVTSWTGPGISIPSVPTSVSGPSGSKGQSNQTYVFSRAVFEKRADNGNLNLGMSKSDFTGDFSQGTITTGKEARIPISNTIKVNSNSMDPPVTETVSGDINVSFPHDFVLVANQAKISASGTVNATVERKAEPRFSEEEPEKYTRDIEIRVDDGTTIASAPYFRTGVKTLNGSWQIPMSFKGQYGDKELTATITGGAAVRIAGGTHVHLKSVVYILQGVEDKSKKGDQTEDQSNNKPEEKPEDSQLTAWLENPSITLVAGRLPSISSHIMIKGWKRDVSSPIEVVFPGQTFGNKLPDNLEVIPGGGSQDPSALSAISSDDGVYRWTEGFDATIQAKPGVYQVPIIVRQAGAGQVQLVLNVKVEKNDNLRSGVINHGDTQSLLNKAQPWSVSPAKKEDSSNTGWNVPGTKSDTKPTTGWSVPSTPNTKPSTGWNVPTTQSSPQSGWNVPSSAHENKPPTGWNVPPTASKPSPGWSVPTTASKPPSTGWNVPSTAAKPPTGWNVPSDTKPSTGWNVPATASKPPSSGWNVPNTNAATTNPSPGWSVPNTSTQPSTGWNAPSTNTNPRPSSASPTPDRSRWDRLPSPPSVASPVGAMPPHNQPQRPTYTPPAKTYTPPPPPPPPPAPVYTQPASAPPSQEGIPRFFASPFQLTLDKNTSNYAAAELEATPNPNLYSVRGVHAFSMCKGAFNVRMNVLKCNCRHPLGDHEIYPIDCYYNPQTRSMHCNGSGVNITVPASASKAEPLSRLNFNGPEFQSIPMPAVPMN